MEIKPDIKRQIQILVALATSASILGGLISVGLYKIDLLIERIDRLELAIETAEMVQNNRLSAMESHIHSRNTMDKGQNDRIKRLEDAFFVPRDHGATKLEYKF